MPVPKDERKVLVVTGNAERSAALTAALDHPCMAVTAVGDEKSIIGALERTRCDLAIVGNRVGHRGPLVLCEAVRVRQPELPVLVLVGDETAEDELAQHEERELSGVRYLDVRGALPLTSQLKGIRLLALEMLELPEDLEAANRWLEVLADLQRAAAERSSTESGRVEMPAAEGEALTEVTPDSESGGGPAHDAPLTEEDVLFARRMVRHTRKVDFRAAPPAPPAADGVDAQVVKLRQRVREQERQLARLAYVYESRRESFDTTEAQLARVRTESHRAQEEAERVRAQLAEEQRRWQREREEVEQQLAVGRQRAEQLEAQLAEAGRQFEKLAQDTTAAVGNSQETAEVARTVLSQLGERSDQIFAQLEQTLVERQAELDGAKQQAQRLEIELRETKARLGFEADARRRDYDEAMQIRASSEERMLQQMNASQDEVRTLLSERGELLAQAEKLKGELSAAGTAVADLRTSVQENQDSIEQLERERAEWRTEQTGLEQAKRELKEHLAAANEALKAQAAAGERRDGEAGGEGIAPADQRTEELIRLAEGFSTREAAWSEERARSEQELSRLRNINEEQRKVVAELEKKEAALQAQIEAGAGAVPDENPDVSNATSEVRWAELKEQIQAMGASLQLIVERSGAGDRGFATEGSDGASIAAPDDSGPSSWPEEAVGPDAETAVVPAHRRGRTKEASRERLVDLARRVGGEDGVTPPQALAPAGNGSGLRVLLFVSLGVVVVLSVIFVGSLVGFWGTGDPGRSDESVAVVVAPPSGESDAVSVQTAPGAPIEKAEPESGGAAGGADPQPDLSPTPSAESEADDLVGAPVSVTPSTAVSDAERVAQRRQVRSELFAALKQNQWERAVELGARLSGELGIDWEAQLRWAEALVRVGRQERSLAVLRDFVDRYPDNLNVGEAKLRVGELLVETGKPDEAQAVYEALSRSRNRKIKNRAKQALRQLERP